MNNSETGKKRKSRTRNSDINQKKYECHCGRKYLSYSALYIHSKQKHGVTITTKAYDSRQEPYRNKPSNSESHNGQQQTPNTNTGVPKRNQNIERAILCFVNRQSKKNPEEMRFLYWVFDQLITCINSNCNLLENYTNVMNYTEVNSCAFVPLIFNFFLVDYCPKTLGILYENSKEKIRNIIADFGQWLCEHHLTEFMIKPNVGSGKNLQIASK